MTFLRIVITLYFFDLHMISAQTRSAFVARENRCHFSGSCSSASRTRLARDTAIDHQLDAGDVFRFIGREKQRRIGDVPGVPLAPNRPWCPARPPHRFDVALGVALRE